MKQENKKIMGIILAVFLIAIIILLIISIKNILDSFSIIEKQQVYTKIIVSDKYGFDLNNTALTFGMIKAGGASSRDLTVENRYPLNVKVDIYTKGDISRFISMSKNNFVLNKTSSERITFVASAPKNTENGVYDGYIYIIIKK